MRFIIGKHVKKNEMKSSCALCLPSFLSELFDGVSTSYCSDHFQCGSEVIFFKKSNHSSSGLSYSCPSK